MSIDEQALGQRIRRARQDLGLTQQQVAEALQIPRPAVSQLEAGKRSLRITELDRLARLFCREPGDFFDAEEQSVPNPVVAVFRAEPSLSNEDYREGLYTALRIGRELARLERNLGLSSRAGRISLRSLYSLGAPRNKGDAVSQGEALAGKERKRLDLGTAPIRDVAELLESQGVRTAWIDLPKDVSGLTLRDREAGVLVAVNRRHLLQRRRFSYAHEYCHVLADADRPATISSEAKGGELSEVRANAFAAALLMPEEGVREYVQSLGKGDRQKKAPPLFLHEVALLAHHFGVSRPAALYRLQNLKLLDTRKAKELREHNERGLGRHVEQLLELPDTDRDEEQDAFRVRFLGLALEAYRREEISRGKLRELATLVDFDEEETEQLLDQMGVEIRLDAHVPEGME